MPYVEMIRVTHDVVQGWGKASAVAWQAKADECAVIVPVVGSVPVDLRGLRRMIRRLEFVKRIEAYGNGIKVVCRVG